MVKLIHGSTCSTRVVDPHGPFIGRDASPGLGQASLGMQRLMGLARKAHEPMVTNVGQLKKRSGRSHESGPTIDGSHVARAGSTEPMCTSIYDYDIHVLSSSSH